MLAGEVAAVGEVPGDDVGPGERGRPAPVPMVTRPITYRRARAPRRGSFRPFQGARSLANLSIPVRAIGLDQRGNVRRGALGLGGPPGRDRLAGLRPGPQWAWSYHRGSRNHRGEIGRLCPDWLDAVRVGVPADSHAQRPHDVRFVGIGQREAIVAPPPHLDAGVRTTASEPGSAFRWSAAASGCRRGHKGTSSGNLSPPVSIRGRSRNRLLGGVRQGPRRPAVSGSSSERGSLNRSATRAPGRRGPSRGRGVGRPAI